MLLGLQGAVDVDAEAGCEVLISALSDFSGISLGGAPDPIPWPLPDGAIDHWLFCATAPGKSGLEQVGMDSDTTG